MAARLVKYRSLAARLTRARRGKSTTPRRSCRRPWALGSGLLGPAVLQQDVAAIQVVLHRGHMAERPQATGKPQPVKAVKHTVDLVLMMLHKKVRDVAGRGRDFVTHDQSLPLGNIPVTSLPSLLVAAKPP